MALGSIENLLAPLDSLTKGMPAGAKSLPINEVEIQRWNVLREDLSLPVAILRQSALDRNARWMQRFCEVSGVKLAPHGKTTMSPQLFDQQMKAGVWAITVATLQQVRVCREFGHDRIILANQLVGRQAIDYIALELRDNAAFEFFCLVDSIEGVDQLTDALSRHQIGRRLNVLVEGGYRGGRTGCRTIEEAVAVARVVQSSSELALRGVEGFEGLDPNACTEDVHSFLQYLVKIAEACDREKLFDEIGPVIMSAGGSAFFDVVASTLHKACLSRPFEVVTRSGCYISLDAAMYTHAVGRVLDRNEDLSELGPTPTNALEVWAYVQSRPESTKVILTAGKRDLSYDVHLPVALHWSRPSEGVAAIPAGHTIVALNDQHAHMTVPADSPLRVGDLVGLGISHPCTTFDKWQAIFLVDDSYNVIGAVRTFF